MGEGPGRVYLGTELSERTMACSQNDYTTRSSICDHFYSEHSNLEKKGKKLFPCVEPVFCNSF